MGNRHSSSSQAGVNPAWLESSLSSGSLSECSSAGGDPPQPPNDIFGQDIRLSQMEIRLIRRSWREARCHVASWEPGLTIFKRLFAESVEIRNLFNWAESDLLAPGENVYRQRLQTHCEVFTSAIDKLVENLDHHHVIHTELTMLGRRHAHMAPHGFKPEFWDQFGHAIVHCAVDWESKSHSNETKEAWRKVVDYMLVKMKKGYYNELRKKHKAQCKRTSTKPSNSEASQSSLTISCMIKDE